MSPNIGNHPFRVSCNYHDAVTPLPSFPRFFGVCVFWVPSHFSFLKFFLSPLILLFNTFLLLWFLFIYIFSKQENKKLTKRKKK